MKLIKKGEVWYFRKQHEGKRRLVSLRTKTKKTAESRAARFLATLKQDGWQAAELELGGGKPLRAGDSPDFEQMKKLYKDYQSSTPNPISENSVRNNLTALNRMFKLSNATTLSEINLRGKKLDTGQVASLRLARSVFKKAALAYYRDVKGVDLTNPFDGVETKTTEITPYNPPQMEEIKQLWEDLEELKPRERMIVQLGLGAGLRKNEIDKARVSWLVGGSIHVQNEDDFKTKSRKSREVPVGKSLVKSLLATRKTLNPSPDDPYLIPMAKRNDVQIRQEVAFDSVTLWLRNKGINDKNRPIHELRKIYGSLLFSKMGVEIAASYLGHSDIKITYQVYANLVKREEAKMEDLLS